MTIFFIEKKQAALTRGLSLLQWLLTKFLWFAVNPSQSHQDAAEFPANVLFVELFDVHHWGVVFAGEPAAALAFLGSAKIATVTTGRLAARAVVLAQAVLHNLLPFSNVQTSLTLHSLNRRFQGRAGTIRPRRSDRLPAAAMPWIIILSIRIIRVIRISPAGRANGRHNEKTKRLITSHLAFLLVTPVGS